MIFNIKDTNGKGEYLPLTGGTLSGSLVIGNSEKTTSMSIDLMNALRHVYLQVTTGGEIRLRNESGNIFNSTTDGTNTFNGTASGNLPLNGGGTVKKEGDTPLVVENTKEGYSYTYIGYKNSNGINYMGFNNGKPYVYGQGDILHTGNSAKVVISQTAPSDTAALWVY